MTSSLWGDALLELARNVPAAFAVIVTVVIFVRLIRNLTADHREDAKVCHRCQDRATDALLENAAAASALAPAIERLSGDVRDLRTEQARGFPETLTATRDDPAAPRPPPDPPAPNSPVAPDRG